jgi:5-hydroxyisourate hydrolase
MFSTRPLGVPRPASGCGSNAPTIPGGRRRARGRPVPTGGCEPGVYRMTFGSGAYFQARGCATFYPEVSITFEMTERAEHYHVPLLLSPFAYSTYRGS